jgi:hypothetical protein
MPKTTHRYIVLPCDGTPYLCRRRWVGHPKEELEFLQKLVGGFIEDHRSKLGIQRDQTDSSPEWRVAAAALSGRGQVWVNEDGRAKCRINKAIAINAVWGDIVVRVTEAAFQKLENRECLPVK